MAPGGPQAHLALHAEDLRAVVGVVRDIAELLDLRSVDLLVLGRYEHAPHPNELQLCANHLGVSGEARRCQAAGNNGGYA